MIKYKDINTIDIKNNGTDINILLRNGQVIYQRVDDGSGPVPPVEDNIIYYTSTDGNIIDVEWIVPIGTTEPYSTLVSNTYEDGIGKLVFDSTLQIIAASAFENCTTLSTIMIPNSVSVIKYYAFNGCTYLSKLNSDNEGEIIIPNSISTIGTRAFGSCIYRVKKVVIPDSITIISSSLFYNCSYLEDIYIPNTITQFGTQAFRELSRLKNIYYSGTIQEWDNIERGTVVFEHHPDNTVLHCADGDYLLYGHE